jgi:putative Ca2+/H+ antiporter (TMEM165/GDT1 family)
MNSRGRMLRLNTLLLLTRSITLSESLNFSLLCLPHLCNGDNKTQLINACLAMQLSSQWVPILIIIIISITTVNMKSCDARAAAEISQPSVTSRTPEGSWGEG